MASYPANHVVVNGATHFQDQLSKDLQRVSLINFWAPWAAPCVQMNEVVIELARRHENVLVLEVRGLRCVRDVRG
jgi:thiol-disulfide isomerase/thioredoxin